VDVLETTGPDGFVGVRVAGGRVGVVVSEKESGDAEVFLSPEQCEQLVRAVGTRTGQARDDRDVLGSFELRATSTQSPVQVTILCRAYPGANDPHDADWLDAEVVVAMHGFSGAFSAYLGQSDLVRLHAQAQQMYETLSGEVKFEPLEPHLTFRAAMNNTGQIAWRSKPSTPWDGARPCRSSSRTTRRCCGRSSPRSRRFSTPSAIPEPQGHSRDADFHGYGTAPTDKSHPFPQSKYRKNKRPFLLIR
jgi:hypothetical protein